MTSSNSTYEFRGTPGPWSIQDDEDSCMGAMFIGRVDHRGIMPDYIVRCTGELDAKAIAATPKLIDALRAFVEPESHVKDGVDPRIDAGRAALIEATGGEK